MVFPGVGIVDQPGVAVLGRVGGVVAIADLPGVLEVIRAGRGPAPFGVADLRRTDDFFVRVGLGGLRGKASGPAGRERAIEIHATVGWGRGDAVG